MPGVSPRETISRPVKRPNFGDHQSHREERKPDDNVLLAALGRHARMLDSFAPMAING